MASAANSFSVSPPSVPDPTEMLRIGYNDALFPNIKNQARLVNFSSPTSNDFYYALFAMQRFAPDVAKTIIEKCAESFGNPNNSVDAAIHCYSILIRNLYAAGKRTLADVVVCDFLRSLPGQESGEISEENVYKKKMQCLYLILTDRAAYNAAPKEIKDEILTLLNTPFSSLRRILSIQPQGSNDVVQANAILVENGYAPDVVYSEQDFETRKSSGSYPNQVIDVFGQYEGGRKLKLKLRSKSRSSRNKSKRKNKNKKNKKKTLRLRIKK